MVQRSVDLDTACALAILQEEVADGQRQKCFEHAEFSPYVVHAKPATPTLLQAPPSCAAGTPTAADDRRGTEAARASGDASKVAVRRGYASSVGRDGAMIMFVLQQSSCT